jgi:hypothetical protein
LTQAELLENKVLYEITRGKRYKKLIDEAMTFVIGHLSMPENVWVDINVKELGVGSWGWCNDLEEEDGYHHFEIEINKQLSPENMVSVIFHEMKHVEQIATGSLYKSIWEGVDQSKVRYQDRGWEKEAYEFEIDMMLLFVNKGFTK